MKNVKTVIRFVNLKNTTNNYKISNLNSQMQLLSHKIVFVLSRYKYLINNTIFKVLITHTCYVPYL